MNKKLAPLLLLGWAIPSLAVGGITSAEEKLLTDAEISRGVRFASGMQWTVSARSQSPSEDSNATLIVRSQAGKASAEVVAPATSAGKKYLLSGGQMYFYRPGTKRAVVVPRRQQVAGDAAIGDIASIGFVQEYVPVSTSQDKLRGESCTKFELAARPGTSASYDRILLWVSNGKRVSREAQYFTRTGKHIRTATFEHNASIKVGGKSIPFLSKLEVVEMLGTPKRTILQFQDYKMMNFPPDTFDVSKLPAAG